MTEGKRGSGTRGLVCPAGVGAIPLDHPYETLCAIIGASKGPIFSVNTEYRYTSFNASHAAVMSALQGVEIELGGSFLEYLGAGDGLVAKASLDRALRGESFVNDVRVGDEAHAQSIFEVSHDPVRTAEGIVVGVAVHSRDLTESQASESALRQSEAMRDVAEQVGMVGSWHWDIDRDRVTWSQEMYALFDVDQDEFDGNVAPVIEARVHLDDRVALDAATVSAAAGEPARVEFRVTWRDGSEHVLRGEGTLERDAYGAVAGMTGYYQDVTERTRAATTLAARERTLATTLDNLPGIVYRCANDPQWTMESISAGSKELTGYAPEELLGNARIAFADLIPEPHREALWQDIQAAIERDEAWTIVYPLITAGGEQKWLWERGVAIRDASGRIEALEGLNVDVTQQHLAEERLERSLVEWRRTFDAMSDSVALLDGEGRVVRANAATTTLTGRDPEDVIGHHCYEVFGNGETFHSDCPQALARRSRRAETSVVEQDGRWLRGMFQPIFDDRGAFDGGVHVVSDVTELERTRRELTESAAQLGLTLKAVVVTLGAATELRDPYTAGHQRRVAQLAVAIAGELGWDEAHTATMQTAALLHDVGKIIVPAEILTKPGRLSDNEMELVRGHAVASAALLADIEFGAPIAAIVNQHHERLDGTGYPGGLRGDHILPEARVLAVADVVEAMSSHRPYRAALGVEAALTEIREHAGVRYDPDVTAACERAFAGGFELID